MMQGQRMPPSFVDILWPREGAVAADAHLWFCSWLAHCFLSLLVVIEKTKNEKPRS